MSAPTEAPTPGPWLVAHATDIVAPAGMVAQAADMDVFGETMANARLIAAAPELLEALGWVQKWMNRHLETTAPCIDGIDRELPILITVKAAIAKAVGS